MDFAEAAIEAVHGKVMRSENGTLMWRGYHGYVGDSMLCIERADGTAIGIWQLGADADAEWEKTEEERYDCPYTTCIRCEPIWSSIEQED